jgi:threonine dehydratase
MSITIDQIRRAADAIPGHVIDTPCLHSRHLVEGHGRARVPEVRELPVHRVIQGARCAQQAAGPGRKVEIIGVRASRFPAIYCAVRKEPATFGVSTIADGIAVKSPGMLTLPIIKKEVSDILPVDDGDIEQANAMLLEIEKTLAEGAAAACLAAVVTHRDRFLGKRVGLVLSGGNIDPIMLAGLIERGMARTDRLTRFIVEMRDLPSALAEVTGCLAELNANIEEISHQRAFTNLPVQTVEVEFVLQTRSHDHVRQVIEALARKSFEATLHLE